MPSALDTHPKDPHPAATAESPVEAATHDVAWVITDEEAAALAARQRQMIRRHRFMLQLATFVVVMSFLLEVRPDQRVQFWFAPSWPLPETCGTRWLFKTDCPGCGLTRSFILMSRGRWDEAFHLNRAGWLMGLAVLLQFPYRLAAMAEVRRGLFRTRPWAEWFGWALPAAVIVNWVARMSGF